MNYITNNNDKYAPIFNKVFGPFFKEVETDEERLDFIFAEFNKEVLQEYSSNKARGDRDDEEEWVQRRVPFRLYKFQQDLLYIDNGQTLQRILRVQRQNGNRLELRGFAMEEFGFNLMKHEYYLFSFPDNINSPFLNNFALNHNKKSIVKNKNYDEGNVEILTYVLNEIKKVII